MTRTAVGLALLLAACSNSNGPAPTPAAPPAPTPPAAGSDAAHEAKGDHKAADFLQALVVECQEAFRRPDPPEKAVTERLKTIDTAPWSDADEWSKLQAYGAAIRARDARMKSDPRYLQAEKKRNWVKENPVFKDNAVTWALADPYVIFQEVKRGDVRDTERKYDDRLGEWQEVPKYGTVNPAKQAQNAEWAAKAEVLARRDGLLFTELHRRFRELFAAQFKLPELKDQGRMLTVLVMWDRTSFEKLMAEAGQPAAGSRGWYDPPQQKVLTFSGDDPDRRPAEIPCADGGVQRRRDQAFAYAGAQQLLHEYGAIYRGTPLKDNDTKVDDRKCAWFEWGFAEFLGACESDEATGETLVGATWRHERVQLSLVAAAQKDRAAAEKWRIRDLLAPNVRDEVRAAGEKLAPGNDRMTGLFVCRAWAFCQFLWNYDDGKYRAKLLDFVKAALAGTHSSERFATKTMERPSLDDWRPVELEFEWYWWRLLDRDVAKRPSTDAPTGNVRDDPEFVEKWRASHPRQGK